MPTPSKKQPLAKTNPASSTGSSDARVVASKVVAAVLDQGETLDSALALKKTESSKQTLSLRDQAFVQALSYSVFRHYYRLSFLLDKLLTRPQSKLPAAVRAALLLGLAQLNELETPNHAAVNESVNAIKRLGFEKLSGMANAVLRRFVRERDDLMSQVKNDEQAFWDCPRWLLEKYKKDWPQEWQSIASAGNKAAPLWLRINQRQCNRTQYLQSNAELVENIDEASVPATALKLNVPLSVGEIPGFNSGEVSIQDISSQWLSEVVLATAGSTLLDACAAPGGKLCGLLEQTDLIATAVDVSAKRMQKVKDNLHRLGLSANCLVADAANLDAQFAPQSFDVIVIDAPCSGTGVIRRHPDIKVNRDQRQLSELVELQQRLLKGLWPLLKSGGRMVYSTCSLLRDENDRQISHFLNDTKDARPSCFTLPVGQQLGDGWQILPALVDVDSNSSSNNSDGFFYARIEKQ